MKSRRAAITIERIERALDEVALAIDRAGGRGAVYLPIFERLERELEKCRAQQTTLSSVKDRLARIQDTKRAA